MGLNNTNVIVGKEKQLARGRQIFNGRREYPLKSESGTKDYVFYLVSAGDAYGASARYFFDKFYPDHRKQSVNTLEEIIQYLKNQVTNQGVSKIREIVIVSHGNAFGLYLPVTDLAMTDPIEEEKYKYLTASSLKHLQNDFHQGDYASFNQNRQTVTAVLDRDSWVTIRACNFGYDKAGMYAFYSFWGGKANVYAPAAYQLFARFPLLKGMKFEHKADKYDHLLRQRFIKRNNKSAKRKGAIVQNFLDKPKLAAPFTLVSYNERNGVPDGNLPNYQAVVDQLNARQRNAYIDTTFSNNNFPLSNQAKVVRKVWRNVTTMTNNQINWIIRDRITTANNQKFKVQYLIEEMWEEIDAINTEFKLLVYGQLMDVPQGRASFPLQLFLVGEEHRLFKGRAFDLAAYYPEGLDQGGLTEYNGRVNALNNNEPAVAFADVDVVIDVDARITQIIENNEVVGWQLHNSDPYIVKEVKSRLLTGELIQRLVGYKILSSLEKMALLNDIGTDPDSPGTELLAYLDQFSIEDLSYLIDYLRANYQPEYAFFIHHAQAALDRKGGEFVQWLTNTDEFAAAINEPLPFFPYSELRRVEIEDKKERVYDFEISSFWKQAREGSEFNTSFQNDLFMEDSLPFTPQQFQVKTDPDSPSFDPVSEPTTDLPSEIQSFFDTEKDTIEYVDIEKIKCQKFRTLLGLLENRGNQTIEEVVELQKDFQVDDQGQTLADYLAADYGATNGLSFVIEIVGVFEVYEGAGIVGALGHLARSNLLFGGGVFFAIYSPFSMLADIAANQAALRDAAEKRGVAVGLFTIAMEVRELMLHYQNTMDLEYLPETVDFTTDAPTAENAYIQFHTYDLRQTVDILYSSDQAFEKGYADGLWQGNHIAKSAYNGADNRIYEMLQNQGLSQCMVIELFKSNLVNINVITGWMMFKFADDLAREARQLYKSID